MLGKVLKRELVLNLVGSTGLESLTGEWNKESGINSILQQPYIAGGFFPTFHTETFLGQGVFCPLITAYWIELAIQNLDGQRSQCAQPWYQSMFPETWMISVLF